jgi:tRNA-dihydrouridine synthase
MIGRGIQGRPWAAARIADALAGRPVAPPPEGAGFTAMVRQHYDAMLDFYGPIGGRVARKHLGWYMDRVGTPAGLRRAILTAAPDEVRARLPDALASTAEARAA